LNPDGVLILARKISSFNTGYPSVIDTGVTASLYRLPLHELPKTKNKKLKIKKREMGGSGLIFSFL
jgi:hypothetical protein